MSYEGHSSRYLFIHANQWFQMGVFLDFKLILVEINTQVELIDIG